MQPSFKSERRQSTHRVVYDDAAARLGCAACTWQVRRAKRFVAELQAAIMYIFSLSLLILYLIHTPALTWAGPDPELEGSHHPRIREPLRLRLTPPLPLSLPLALSIRIATIITITIRHPFFRLLHSYKPTEPPQTHIL